MNSAPWLSTGRLSVLGTGIAMPGPAVSSEALVAHMASRFGFARERQALVIARRMAITHRHVCRPFEARYESATAGQSNPELAARAAQQALDRAALDISDIGYVIGHTATPHQALPSNIALAADYLGYRGPHMEIRQACTGFANALVVAFGLLASADAAPVLIVGSETGSLFFDPERADTDAGQLVNMIQMGDGAGAIIVAPHREGRASITAAWYGAMGLNRAPGIQMRPGAAEFHHEFGEIMTSGRTLFEAGVAAAARHNIVVADADIVIPHQVSGRIGAQVAEHFGISASRLFVNADRVGNTGSAAIWIALAMLRGRGMAAGTRAVTLGAEATKFMYGGFTYDHC